MSAHPIAWNADPALLVMSHVPGDGVADMIAGAVRSKCW